MKHRPDAHISHLIPEDGAPLVSPHALGVSAVDAENRWVTDEFNLGQLELNAQIRDQIKDQRGWERANLAPVARTVGSLVGKTMTVDERSFVRDIDRHEKQASSIRDRSDAYKERVDDELSRVRDSLLGLDEAKGTLLDEYLSTVASPFLRSVKSEATKDMQISWREWLGMKASDRQLMNFLQWHVRTLERMQQRPEFVQFVEKTKEDYQSAVLLAVEKGWLAFDARAASHKVSEFDVYAGDLFDTVLRGRHGYHYRGSNHIVVVPTVYIRPDGKEQLFHETNHATIGARTSESPQSMRSIWLDEALTEHVGLALAYGDESVIDPMQRTDVSKAYLGERLLLATLLTSGSVDIPASYATRAYSGGAAEVKAFESVLAQSYGHEQVIGMLTAFIERATEWYAQKGNNYYDARQLATRQAARWIKHDPSRLFGQRQSAI